MKYPIEHMQAQAERFWSRVNIADPHGCWEWQALRNADGYGRFPIGAPYKGIERAHRMAWVLANLDEIPDGLIVRHHCDNPPCVNPRHLALGTVYDNAQDSKRRRRNNYGTRNGNARLTDSDVLEIRRRSSEGESNRSIAKALGFPRTHYVTRILSGERWGLVENCGADVRPRPTLVKEAKE